MKSKSFELLTYVYKNGETFYEHDEKLSEQEQANLYLGYFNKNANVSIDDCKDGKYLICYISSDNGEHKIIKVNDKFELLSKYHTLLMSGQEEGYINIFDLNDITYI